MSQRQQLARILEKPPDIHVESTLVDDRVALPATPMRHPVQNETGVMNMFGNKQDKRARLAREVDLLHAHNEISIEDMARAVGVDRATIESDLVSLDDAGVKLYEGKRGRLGLPDWMRAKRRK